MPHVYAGTTASGDHEVAGQRPALPIGFVKRQRRATPGGVISLG